MAHFSILYPITFRIIILGGYHSFFPKRSILSMQIQEKCITFLLYYTASYALYYNKLRLILSYTGRCPVTHSVTSATAHVTLILCT